MCSYKTYPIFVKIGHWTINGTKIDFLYLDRFLKMKNIKVAFLIILGTIPNLILAQHNLSLKVGGVASNVGDICYAVYTNESSFLKFDQVFKSGSQKAVQGETNIQIMDLPEGSYAVAIFHDENGNQHLDTNMIGVPKEEIAFSKGKMKIFGPPKFNECAFTLNTNMEMIITMP